MQTAVEFFKSKMEGFRLYNVYINEIKSIKNVYKCYKIELWTDLCILKHLKLIKYKPQYFRNMALLKQNRISSQSVN